ncbi:MAG: hypothetical protein Ta2E_01830 [Mycoplasmoidaceae bacterium]|nr:MAG: hypothetical protein Ta2E_01830 [Mycoplasmoidaceae bacterium]
MTITAVSQFSFDDPVQNTVHISMITYTLDGTKTITDFLDYLVTQMNDILNKSSSGNNFIVTYMFNNTLLMILSNLPFSGINSSIIFAYGPIKFFNITSRTMTKDINITVNMIPMLSPHQAGSFLDVTVPIMINQNHNINFQNFWERYKLFLHSSFITASSNYVCEVNESHHKLCKKYPLNDMRFDIWFRLDGMRWPTFKLEIDIFVLELTFQDDWRWFGYKK